MGNRAPRQPQPVVAPAAPAPNIQQDDDVAPVEDLEFERELRGHEDRFVRAALEASLTDSPLPIGWEQAYTPKGIVYFIDHLHQTTSFLDPRLAAHPATSHRNKKRIPAGPPPKYKADLYGKSQRLRAQVCQLQHDEGQLDVDVARDNIFEESYRLLGSLDSLTLTRRLVIKFQGEEGLDYGGMSRDWFHSLAKEVMKPERNMFMKSPKGQYYQINKYKFADTSPASTAEREKLLEQFYFVGLLMGMAVYHAKLFPAPLAPYFYKALLEKEPALSDLKAVDESLYKSMKKVRDAEDINDWDLYYTLADKDENGKEIDVNLIPNGASVAVTNANKAEFLEAVVRYYFKSTQQQMEEIARGFRQLIPANLLTDYNENELEQLVSGTTEVDVLDWKESTVYEGDFTESPSTIPTIKLFWEVVSAFSQVELRKLLQFTTGSMRVPIGGFMHLHGSNGPQRFTIISKKTKSLPTSHSCFNRLELSTYTDKEKLKKDLLLAISETAGFGLQ